METKITPEPAINVGRLPSLGKVCVCVCVCVCVWGGGGGGGVHVKSSSVHIVSMQITQWAPKIQGTQHFLLVPKVSAFNYIGVLSLVL